MSNGSGPPRVSPAPIFQMTTAYWASSVLLTANRIGLFTAVGTGALSVAEVAQKLALSEYPLATFLDTLVALGYLERKGDAYANTSISLTYLVAGQPAYLGEALKYSDDLYPVW